MREFFRSLQAGLRHWAEDWFDVVVVSMQVAGILLGAWLVMRVMRLLINRLTTTYSMPPRVAQLSRRVVGLLVYGGALLWSLERMGVSGSVLWGAFTGFATVGAVAFFAAWSVLSNLFCALLIYTTRSFRTGDVVELLEAGDKPGIKGQVMDINLVYTTLLETGDHAQGTTLQVPNSLFFQRALRRWHAPPGADTIPPG